MTEPDFCLSCDKPHKLAHGEHPDDHDPTDKELTAYYGTQ